MIRESILHKTLPPDFIYTSTEFMITFYTDAKTALTVKGISPHLISIVEYVLENKVITNTDVQKLLKVSKPSATRYLKELETLYLERHGETGKGTTYIFKGLTKGSEMSIL